MKLKSTPPVCVKCGDRLLLQRMDRNMHLRCSCMAELDFVIYNAYTEQPEAVDLETGGLDGQAATCFVHADKPAVAVCASCGRFACALCSVQEGKDTLCLDCFAERESPEKNSKSITRWDNIALGLAVGSFVIFWLGIVGALGALYISLRHWNAKGNEWRKISRVKYVISILLAIANVGFWFTLMSRWNFPTQ